jgi:hypothetical protein
MQCACHFWVKFFSLSLTPRINPSWWHVLDSYGWFYYEDNVAIYTVMVSYGKIGRSSSPSMELIRQADSSRWCRHTSNAPCRLGNWRIRWEIDRDEVIVIQSFSQTNWKLEKQPCMKTVATKRHATPVAGSSSARWDRQAWLQFFSKFLWTAINQLFCTCRRQRRSTFSELCMSFSILFYLSNYF